MKTPKEPSILITRDNLPAGTSFMPAMPRCPTIIDPKALHQFRGHPITYAHNRQPSFRTTMAGSRAQLRLVSAHQPAQTPHHLPESHVVATTNDPCPQYKTNREQNEA